MGDYTGLPDAVTDVLFELSESADQDEECTYHAAAAHMRRMRDALESWAREVVRERDAARRDAHDALKLMMAANDLRREERARTDALVAALPDCTQCGRSKATRMGLYETHWCDGCEHIWNTDLRYAEPLRAILAARREGK
jgi:hypothetical protein